MLGGVFPALPGLSGRMDFPLTHTVLFGFFSFILLCSEVWKEGYSTGVEQTLLQVRAGMTGLPCKVAACNPLRWIIGWLLLATFNPIIVWIIFVQPLHACAALHSHAPSPDLWEGLPREL